MDRILYQIGQVLGATLIHSLWQGLIVYFTLRILLTIPFKSAVKYILSYAGLTAIAVWFIYTLCNEVVIYNHDVVQPNNPSALPLMLILPTGIHHLNAEATRYYYSIASYLPWLSAIYALGFIYNGATLISARRQITQLKKHAQIHSALQHQAEEFGKLLRISKSIAVKVSDLVDVPCVAGAIKPVILLPVTLSTSLSAEETEAILLHELAHIRRHDYLANLVQQSIRVLLFFNPFAHLTMAIVNRERENSCDDMVVAIAKKPLIYAQTLVKLEEARRRQWQLALSATGKKYHLLNRIERIMKPKKTTTSIGHIVFTVTMFTIGIITIAWLNPTVAKGKVSIRNLKPAIEKVIAAITPESNVKSNGRAALANDTTKKHYAKPEPFNADSGNVNVNGYQLFGFNDPEFDALNAEYHRLRKIVDDYYHNDKYQLLEGRVHGYNHPLVRNYDNDTLRNLMTALHRTADSIRLSYETPDNTRRAEIGKNVGTYFSSEDFKKLNSMLQKKYKINPGLKYDEKDPAYEKYQNALKKSMPAGIQQQLDELVSLSREAQNKIDSPQYMANFKHFKAIGDSLKEYYKKPHLKQYTDTTKTQLSDEEMKKAWQEFQAYRNNAEIKHDEELMKEYIRKIGDRMQTAEFRQHVQEWKNQLHTVLNGDYDKILHADKKDE